MKIINLNHEICDYTCMWNGIEDIYRNKTGFNIPPHFFFGLSGFCSPAYIKISKNDVPRAMYFSSGQPKKMYEFMEDKIGYKYSFIENRSFGYSLKRAKEQIDNNNPVVIGASDMYYLEYHKKFYHKLHIPIHYFLMIGYDDDKKCIYLYDCGKLEKQTLSYENLEKAWNVNVNGLSKKNTLYILNFNEHINDVKTIFYAGLNEKANINLHSKVNFIGYKAFIKLATEIELWNSELTPEQYKKCLLHLVEYAGFPPKLPDQFNKIDGNHNGARFQFAELLKWGAKTYNEVQLANSANEFINSGKLIEKLCYEILKCVVNNRTINHNISEIIMDIGAHEKLAYEYIEKCF